MTGGETLIGVGAVAGINIIIAAYGYGKITEKVRRIEVFLNGEFKQMKKDTLRNRERIIRLETLGKAHNPFDEQNEDNVG
uniref:Uncharacterized protein n=1 Tax=viral metagenome TaxID=1070528 RepID=A0A6M3JZM5_9ZZZZ